MTQQVKIPNPIWVEVKAEIAHTVLLDFIDDAAHFADGIDERGNATSYYSEEGQDCFNKLYDMVEETMLNCGIVDEDQAEKSPDPEPEIVRAGSLLSSPSFLCIFDGDRAEIHTAASFAKAYPDHPDVAASIEKLSGDDWKPNGVGAGYRYNDSFADGQITIERVI
jgi:hypothetical protein